MSNPFGYQSTYQPFGSNPQSQQMGADSPLSNPLYSKTGSGFGGTGNSGPGMTPSPVPKMPDFSSFNPFPQYNSSPMPNTYTGQGSAFDMNFQKDPTKAYATPEFREVSSQQLQSPLRGAVGGMIMGPANSVFGKKYDVKKEQDPWANPMAAFNTPANPVWGTPNQQRDHYGKSYTPTQEDFSRGEYFQGGGHQTPLGLYNQIMGLSERDLGAMEFSNIKKSFDSTAQELSNAWANPDYGNHFRNGSQNLGPNGERQDLNYDLNWLRAAYDALIRKGDSMRLW